MWTSWHILMVILLACVPAAGEAQIIKTIKDHATKKVDDRKKTTDSTLVHATDKAVDSTLAKTSRPVDTLVSRASAVVDTTLNRTEKAVSAGLKHRAGEADDDRIAKDLANGRLSLPELRFVDGTDRLDSAAAPILQRVATALGSLQGNYLIEGHGASSGNDAADLSLFQRRAVAVKAALLALGVPVDRLFAMGFAPTTAPNGGVNALARIEIARMQ